MDYNTMAEEAVASAEMWIAKAESGVAGVYSTREMYMMGANNFDRAASLLESAAGIPTENRTFWYSLGQRWMTSAATAERQLVMGFGEESKVGHCYDEAIRCFDMAMKLA